MINLYTKFKAPACCRYEDMNGGAKCTNWFGAVKGHSRSSAMSPFDRAHTTSYSTFNRNHASILYRFPDIESDLSKVADFDPPHLHLASQ